MEVLILVIVGIVVLVFVMRLLGAWMLRINEIIRGIKLLNQQIKDLNKHFEVKSGVSQYPEKRSADTYKKK